MYRTKCHHPKNAKKNILRQPGGIKRQKRWQRRQTFPYPLLWQTTREIETEARQSRQEEETVWDRRKSTFKEAGPRRERCYSSMCIILSRRIRAASLGLSHLVKKLFDDVLDLNDVILISVGDWCTSSKLQSGFSSSGVSRIPCGCWLHSPGRAWGGDRNSWYQLTSMFVWHTCCTQMIWA